MQSTEIVYDVNKILFFLTLIHACIYNYINTIMYIDLYACMYVHTHAHTHAHAHAHAHTHTHTHTHTQGP